MRVRLILGVLIAVLLPLAVVTAAPAMAVANVQIGNGPAQVNGSYLNAQNLADTMVFTSLVVQGASSITISDPVDLSTSTFGSVHFSLTLTAPVCNISNQVNFSSAGGQLFLTCGTINWGATITSGGTLMPASRIVSTATQANVQSNAASIQQAIDDSSPSSPVTVSVAAGQYAEGLTVNHAVDLTGDDGTGPSGAGPNAPVISGVQAGGSVITATANNVSVDGLHLAGVVSTGPTTRSLDGVNATDLDTVSVSHNTFEGFSGPAVQTTGSTNVDLSANDITPTLLSTSLTPANPSIVAGTDQQLTDTGTDSEGASTDQTSAANWSTSNGTVASVNATGLVHAASQGTATITATVGDQTATTVVQVRAVIPVPPADVMIGNGPSAPDGSYYNAQNLADNMTLTSLIVQGSASVTIADPIDLSTSVGGPVFHNLTLIAPVCNISNQFNFSSFGGRLFLTCGTINWDATITSGGTLMPATRIVSTATQATVESDAASIQQAIDDSSPTSPVVVNVGAGQYAGNLTISHALQLHGDDGLNPSGAGNLAPDISGTQVGAAVITATANDVSIDGLHVTGVVSTGPTTRSLNAFSAHGLDTISVQRNTFDGFSGPAVDTTGSTHVDVSSNDITPTLLSTSVTPVNPSLVAGTTQQLTDTGSYSEGPDADLTATATWSTSDNTVATVDAAGLVHGAGPGTATITATVGDQVASTGVQVTPVVVSGPQPQTITFTSTPPASPAVGSTYAVAATATSGLPVKFGIGTKSTAKACKLTGSTVTFTGAGTCIVNANQAGNASWLAAPRVQQSLTVGLVSQAPAFLPAHPATTAYAGSAYLAAFAATGGPTPTFALAPGAPAWLSVDPNSGGVTGMPPTGTSSFSYAVVASNGSGQVTAGPYTVAVSALPKSALRANVWLTLTCPAKAKVTVTITCTAVVSNLGPAAATNFHAVIVLPDSVTPITPSAGGSVVGRDVSWSGATLASGASVTFSVTARATLAGTFTTADAVWSDTADAKPANNVKSKVETFTGP